MEMSREIKLQRIERDATETRRSAEDKMNLPGQLSTISLAAGKMEEGIMLEILLALPVKSLIRFKCVCKSWCSFISDPEFGKSHLNRCMLQNPNSSQKLVFRVTDPADDKFMVNSLDYERSNFESFDIADDKLNCLVRLRFPIPHPRYCTMFGTCDGLVCLTALYKYRCRFIVIWNPTTGAFKEILSPASHFNLLGFGYDPVGGDYKILISVKRKKFSNVQVFALKGESWREVCKMLDLNSNYGVYLNGCIHWFPTKKSKLGGTPGILSFDLSKEKFERVIPLPDIDTNIYGSLAVLRGCLCVYSYWLLHNKCCIMEEYGLKTSWTEFQLPEGNIRGSVSYPVCIRTDGKVLGVLSSSGISNGFYLYSMQDNSCQTTLIGDLVISHPCIYVESLVSP